MNPNSHPPMADTQYLMFFTGRQELDPGQEMGHFFGTVFLSEAALRKRAEKLFPNTAEDAPLAELARLFEEKGYSLAEVIKPAAKPVTVPAVVPAIASVAPAGVS